MVLFLDHLKPSNKWKSLKTLFAIVVFPDPEDPTIKPTFHLKSSIGISTSNSFFT